MGALTQIERQAPAVVNHSGGNIYIGNLHFGQSGNEQQRRRNWMAVYDELRRR